MEVHGAFSISTSTVLAVVLATRSFDTTAETITSSLPEGILSQSSIVTCWIALCPGVSRTSIRLWLVNGRFKTSQGV